MFGLPFKQVWALDFEFVAPAGALPAPVCLVAQELGSRRLIRLWQDQLGAEPPFPVDDDTLFVAYYASAELGCFLQLGWPLPPRLLDLYTEFRNATNGLPLPEGRGLLSALSYHGIPAITAEQKHAERELVMRGGPWSAAERRRILDYCQTDVDPLGALLERMLPEIMVRPNGFGRGCAPRRRHSEQATHQICTNSARTRTSDPKTSDDQHKYCAPGRIRTCGASGMTTL